MLLQVLCTNYFEIDWATTINAISTVIMAIFTALTWRILYKQDKMRNDPELRAFCYPPEIVEPLVIGTKGFDFLIEIVIVNPGTVPAVITNIKEVFKDTTNGQDLTVQGRFDLPILRPIGVYISQLPWVVGGGKFAICRRRYNLPSKFKEKELLIQFKFNYFVSKKEKILKTYEMKFKLR